MRRRPMTYCDTCEGMVYADAVHSCYDAKAVREHAERERALHVSERAELVWLREQLAVTDAQIEAAARGIYLHKYGAMGGRWECVETKDVWHDLARAALTAAREVQP